MRECIRILIYGSCVSRDIFNNGDAASFKIVDYIARSSFASAFDAKQLEDKYSSGLASPFQARLVKSDWDKSFSRNISELDFDILLVDFIDERFNLFAFDDGGICTVSSELTNSGFKKDCERGREIKSGSDEFFQAWESGWSKFVSKLKARDLLSMVRINRVYWAKNKSDGSSFSASLEESLIDAANMFLDRIYTRVEKDIPSDQFLCYPNDLIVGALDHRWGVSPFHYVGEFYEYAQMLIGRDMSSICQDRKVFFGITTFPARDSTDGAADWRMRIDAYILLNFSLPAIEKFSMGRRYFHIVRYENSLPVEIKKQLYGAVKKYDFLILSLLSSEADGRDAANEKALILAKLHKLSEGRDVDGVMLATFRFPLNTVVSSAALSHFAENLRPINAGKHFLLGKGVSSCISSDASAMIDCRYRPVSDSSGIEMTASFVAEGGISESQSRALPANLDGCLVPGQVDYIVLEPIRPVQLEHAEEKRKWVERLLHDRHRDPEVGLADGVIPGFEILNELLQRRYKSRRGLCERRTKLSSTPLFFEIGSGVQQGRDFVIEYATWSEAGIKPNCALMTLRLNSETDDPVQGFALSENPHIRHYRYMLTLGGEAGSVVVGRLPEGVDVGAVGICTWGANADVFLDALSVQFFDRLF